MVTFPIYQFSNILSQKIEKKFGGNPLSDPLKLKPLQKDPPWLPITPSFQPRIIFYNKNGGVCKKLELNILKIDQVIAILSSKKVFQTKFEFSNKIRLTRETCYNSANFQDNFNFFPLDVHWWVPLLVYWSKMVPCVLKYAKKG